MPGSLGPDLARVPSVSQNVGTFIKQGREEVRETGIKLRFGFLETVVAEVHVEYGGVWLSLAAECRTTAVRPF